MPWAPAAAPSAASAASDERKFHMSKTVATILWIKVGSVPYSDQPYLFNKPLSGGFKRTGSRSLRWEMLRQPRKRRWDWDGWDGWAEMDCAWRALPGTGRWLVALQWLSNRWPTVTYFYTSSASSALCGPGLVDPFRSKEDVHITRFLCLKLCPLATGSSCPFDVACQEGLLRELVLAYCTANSLIECL